MTSRFRPWKAAWHDALYGPDGFYRRAEGPAGHFATSAQGIPGVDVVLANTVLALAQSCEAEVIVDFACGRGELLRALSDLTNEAELTSEGRAVDDAGTGTRRPRLVGVDVVDRPATLGQDIEWVKSAGAQDVPQLPLIGKRALVIAHEWLDVVPTTVVEADESGVWREVFVARDGEEELREPPAEAELAWANRCRSTPMAGERLEIGSTRDEAWSQLVAQVRESASPGSVVVGVDYFFQAEHTPPLGTLTGFADGAQTSPTPDGSCDLTAHVCLDWLDFDSHLTQRELFLDLFGTEPLEVVPIELARTNPPEYLARMSARSAFGAATASEGLGGFAWWFKQV